MDVRDHPVTLVDVLDDHLEVAHRLDPVLPYLRRARLAQVFMGPDEAAKASDKGAAECTVRLRSHPLNLP
jgi:hypothetical protein